MASMLANNGQGGKSSIMGMLNELPPNALESIMPLQELKLEKLLQMLFPLMQQALIFNFPGGTLWNLLIKFLAEKLQMSIGDFKAQMGIEGGSSVDAGAGINHGLTSGVGGGEKSSGISYD